eukprot:scaffold102389_cov29-Tisochrysis_lutea.AAC.4
MLLQVKIHAQCGKVKCFRAWTCNTYDPSMHSKTGFLPLDARATIAQRQRNTWLHGSLGVHAHSPATSHELHAILTFPQITHRKKPILPLDAQNGTTPSQLTSRTAR